MRKRSVEDLNTSSDSVRCMCRSQYCNMSVRLIKETSVQLERVPSLLINAVLFPSMLLCAGGAPSVCCLLLHVQ